MDTDFVPQVLYEDNHLIAVYKPPGEIVQGDKTGDQPIAEKLKDYIKKRDNKPGNVFVGVIHRLDRPVSGVLLLAKTSKALSRMNEQFRQKETKKTYRAIVVSPPPHQSELITSWLIKDQARNKSRSLPHEVRGSKKAATRYSLKASSERYYLLEVIPETGRHHQIRVHLSSIGCPIKGDLKYGAPRSNPDGSIHLHAYKLEFIHPVSKKEVCILSPPPNEKIWMLFNNNFLETPSLTKR